MTAPRTLEEQIRRDTTDGRLEAVALGARITLPTLVKLLALIEEKTDYGVHIEVAVKTGPMLKTLDNEDDALETIRRLEAAPTKCRVDEGAKKKVRSK